jgi:hypothetical protein
MTKWTTKWLGKLNDTDKARLEKQPGWVRGLVNDQLYRIAELENRIAELTGDNLDSNVTADPYHESPYHLPQNTRVSFLFQRKEGDKTTFGRAIQVEHVLARGDPALYVSATQGGLRIEPWAANCFRVYPSDR